jgi:hypothetical protein
LVGYSGVSFIIGEIYVPTNCWFQSVCKTSFNWWC